MGKYDNLTFEGKHIDEKILYFSNPSKIQLKIELFKIILPLILVDLIFVLLYFYNVFSFVWFIILFLIFTWFSLFSIFYKIYRTKNNYLYITSKRILFHWMNWFFKDYVKKISFENVRNINYFTVSFFWKIFWYGNIEIQSSHWWHWDITLYHMENWKMIAHYIDKLISLTPEERKNFAEFDKNYFKK